MPDYTKMHEWELASKFKDALKNEDYTACAAIKKEVSNRIANKTIDHNLMDGFRYYDPEKQDFVGGYDFNGLNGLFDGYLKK